MHYIKWFFWNGLFALTTYLGLYENIEGAKNIAVFWAWLISICSLVLFSNKVTKAMIENNEKKGQKFVSRSLDISFSSIIIGIFVWFNYIVLPIFLFLQIVAVSRIKDSDSKLKIMESK